MKKKPAKLQTATIKRKTDNCRLIELPRMKGRVLEKVEVFTPPDYHALTLYFQDETSLTLVIEPCFRMAAALAYRSAGEQHILKRWP